jgi:hypothetical protein
VLHNVPWCVLPCLLASGGPAAFEIAAPVRAVTEQVGARVLCQWVVRHPDPGYRLLGERAAAGMTVPPRRSGPCTAPTHAVPANAWSTRWDRTP